MCPDPDLYSSYLDGEIPSPWKERLASHMESCEACKKRYEKYRQLHIVMHSDVPAVSQEIMESSFTQISARHRMIVQTMYQKKTQTSSWIQKSVRLPLPAFAAILLAAIFLPSIFVMQSAGSVNREQTRQFNAILSALQQNMSNQHMVNTSLPVIYSPDMPERTVSNTRQPEGGQIFTVVDYGKNFATDKTMFSNAEIIIISLPDITRFSNTGEQLFSRKEASQRFVNYYK
ncbi:hypothetical protein K7I13_05095 [Brucepastera parasyntrophica]|uniref:anti-sigma factor family protein n=1 Tax=Brucepastera parasyntrophica TaxID=2880008 RepID=UPI00210BA3BB|nr:hypothetical protein [Brucepastera parasyntrophica]ULQ60653.1 hypothetical protein K7I13_05095 [Brucepastera parasyntrophica]